jgi:hypothetical protein
MTTLNKKNKNKKTKKQKNKKTKKVDKNNKKNIKKNINITKIKKYHGGFCSNIPNQKIYILKGHGCITNEYFPVPENCIYITLALCGKEMGVRQVYKTFSDLFILQSDLLINPCNKKNFRELNNILTKSENPTYNETNYENLIEPDPQYDKLSSSYLNMHYSGNDDSSLHTYLDNMYQPLDSHVLEKSNKNPTKVLFFKSGLYEIMQTNDKLFKSIFTLTIPNNYNSIMLNKHNIKQLYDGSIYPTTDQIISSINEYKQDNYGSISNYLNNFIIDKTKIESTSIETSYIISYTHLYNIINQYFVKTQKYYFEKYPGIYYNIVCRSPCTTTDEKEILLKRQTSFDNKKKLFDIIETEEDEEINQLPIYNFSRLKHNLHKSYKNMSKINLRTPNFERLVDMPHNI